MLPGADGRLVLQALREQDPTLPVLFVSARGTVDEDLWQLERVFIVTLPAAAALAALLAWLASRSLTAPITRLNQAMAAVEAHAFDQSVTVGKSGDALAQLAVRYNDMLSRLRASFLSLEQFSADVAHELRTPLMAMQANAESALLSDQPGALQPALQDILDDIRRLSELIDRLLLLVRSDRSALALIPTEIALATLLGEVRETMLPLADAAGMCLTTTAVMQPVICDVTLMKQVLMDVIDNAIRHGASPIIVSGDVVCLDDATWVAIDVSDSGPGIAAEARELALSRFGRLTVADAPRPDIDRIGYGLGLSLAVSILTAHQGSVALRDTVGGDLVVRLRWPLRRKTRDVEPEIVAP